MIDAPRTTKLDISVVIPAFNEESRIAHAIRSVREQTHTVFEIIVVDDGSSDQTVRIAEEAGARVFRLDRVGVSAARNFGVAQVRGDWVAFLDADDLWVPTKLEEQCRAQARFPQVEFVVSDFSREQLGVIHNAVWLRQRQAYRDVVGERIDHDSVHLNSDELANCLTRENFIPTSSVLVKRDLLRRIGGFDESMSHCEDHDCWMRLLRENDAIIVQSSLVRYQMHEGSASSHWEKILEGDVQLIRHMLEFEQRYHPRAVLIAKKLLPNHLSRLGQHFARIGKPQAAIGPLWESFYRKPSVTSLGWLAFSGSLLLQPMRKLFLNVKALKHAASV